LFANGGAKIFIKRGGKFGTILESEALDVKSIASSSGPLQDNDLITLSTKPFLDIIDPPSLFSSLASSSPAEIAETLTPKVHEKEEGGASAFIIKYVRQDQAPEQSSDSQQEEPLPIKDRFFTRVSHSKKVYLTVAVVILIILSSSIFFAVKKQSDTKNQALFKEIYPSALKKYEEGNSLVDLNASLAKESLLASKKSLEENKEEFKEGSEEEKQISELLEKINEDLKKIEETGSSGLIIDVSAVSVVDSFLGRLLGETAKMAGLIGAETVLVGMKKEVVITLIQLGMVIKDLHTALNIEDGMMLLEKLKTDKSTLQKTGS